MELQKQLEKRGGLMIRIRAVTLKVTLFRTTRKKN
jgi:hypothetical protein